MKASEYLIKPLELEDVYKFKSWQRGNYYLLNDYDFIYEEDWDCLLYTSDAADDIALV